MTIQSLQHRQRMWLKFVTAVLAGLGLVGAASAVEPAVSLQLKKPLVVEPVKPIEIKPLDLKKVNPKLVLSGKQVKPVEPKQVLPKDMLPKDLVQKLQPKKPGLPKDLLPKDIVFNPQPKKKPAGPKDLVAKPNPKFPGPGDGKPGDLKPNEEDNGNGGNGGNGNGGNGNGDNNDPNWLEWLAWLAWLKQQGHHHHDVYVDDLQPPVIIVPGVPQIVVPLPQQEQAKRFEVPIGADLPLGGANFGVQTGYAILQMGDLTVSLETPAWQADAIVVRLPELKLLSAANADLHLYDVEGQYLTTILLKLTPSE